MALTAKQLEAKARKAKQQENIAKEKARKARQDKITKDGSGSSYGGSGSSYGGKKKIKKGTGSGK